MMIDSAELWVLSGGGGDGCSSFRREKYVPKGGPDGGDGGDGGSVYFYGDMGRNTLLHFQYRKEYGAGSGGQGKGKLMRGKDGESIYLAVPLGTRVWRDNEEEPQVEVLQEGKQYLVVRGGMGGRGNTQFASSTNRTPVLAEAGEWGERLHLWLELRLLADVALIGQPNAGKSTLLAQISRARPKAAAYPFTTLDPVLGVAEVGGRQFVAVEIPGLIEGSHKGVGLGDEFLRHAQHTRVFVHLVDATAEDPLQAYLQVAREVELFDPAMAQRPGLVAVNKVDVPGTKQVAQRLRRRLGPSVQGVYPISAATGEGVRELLEGAAALLAQVADVVGAPAPGRQPPPVAVRGRRQRAPVQVTKAGDGSYVVVAPDAERLVRGTNLRQWRARLQLWQEFRRLGVASALERAGAEDGAVVRLGDTVLEWV